MATDKSGPWRPSNGKTRTAFVALIAFIVAFGMAAPAIAATSNDPVTDHLNTADWDTEETAPNPVINVSVTTSSQDLSQGTSHQAIAGYEDDGGDWVDGADTAFTVNTTHDIDDGTNANPYSFNPAHIDDAGLQAFPDGHDENSDWLNSSTAVWNQETGSSNLSVTETTVASNVDAIRFDTGTSGDSTSDGAVMFEASYNGTDHDDGESELGLDSDELKLVLLVSGDLDTLETNAELQIRIYDESGDYKQIVANDSQTALSGNVFANGTGSFFYQIKLNKLSTTGGGSWDNIQNVTVRSVSSGSSDGDVDVSISALDLRRKAKLDLGEMRATTNDDGNDPDSDGDYDEFQTHYNATGDISVYSMGTLDAAFDDAAVTDLTYPARFEASGLESQGQEGTYNIEWEEAENPGYAAVLNVTYALELPSVIDLSYSNTEVRMTQKWNDRRYLALEQASEVSDSTNLSDASYSSVSTASKGDLVTIQGSSVDSGERFLVHYELELTSEERSGVEAAADGGAGAPVTDGGGGIIGSAISFVTNPLGAVISIIVGLFAFSRFRR